MGEISISVAIILDCFLTVLSCYDNNVDRNKTLTDNSSTTLVDCKNRLAINKIRRYLVQVCNSLKDKKLRIHV